MRPDAGQRALVSGSGSERLYFSIDENGGTVSELPPVPEPQNYASAAARVRNHHTNLTSVSDNTTQQAIQRRRTAAERADERRHRPFPHLMQPSDFTRPPTEADFAAAASGRLSSRPESRTGSTNLPTPPLDTSDPLLQSLPGPHTILERHAQMPTPASILERHNHNSAPSSHPLSFEQRAPSPDDGLGDRRRSLASSGDVWDVIRSTITPDETLPSTHNSSFVSAAESASSQLSSSDTTVVPNTHIQPEMHDTSDSDTVSSASSDPTWGSEESSLRSSDDDSGPEEDSEVNWERRDERRSIGRRLYDRALQSEQGRAEIDEIRRARLQDPRYVDETRRMMAREAHSASGNAATSTRTEVNQTALEHGPPNQASIPRPPHMYNILDVQTGTRHRRTQSETHRLIMEQMRNRPHNNQRQRPVVNDEEEQSQADAAADSIRSISDMLTQLNENLRQGAQAAEVAEVEAMREAMRHVVQAQRSRRQREHGRRHLVPARESATDGHGGLFRR